MCRWMTQKAERCSLALASTDEFLTRNAVAGPEFFLIARLACGARWRRLKFHLKFITGDLEGIAVIQWMFREALVQEFLERLALLTATDARAVHLSAVAAV